MARRRMRRSYRRFRSRFHRPHKQSLVSKLTSAGAILIGAAPVIQQAQLHLLNGDIQGFADEVGNLYSAGLTKGSFRWDSALQAYGPIVGAILFKKAMGKLLKIAHIKF